MKHYEIFQFQGKYKQVRHNGTHREIFCASDTIYFYTAHNALILYKNVEAEEGIRTRTLA